MISLKRIAPRNVAGMLAALTLAMSALSSVAQAAEPTLASAQAAYLRGDYANASVDYESVARSATGPFAADYWLLAADAAVRGGDGYRADQLLNRLDRQPLDEHQAGRLQLLRGQAALARNDTAGALRYLPENGGDETLRDAVLLARGRALYRSGDALGGTTALVKRETSLASAEALQANRAAIWQGVTSTPSRPLAPGQAVDMTSRGWLELGRLAQQQPVPLAELDAWRKRYPGHPGEERIAQLMMPAREVSSGRSAPASSLPAPAAPAPAPAARTQPAPSPAPPPAPAVSETVAAAPAVTSSVAASAAPNAATPTETASAPAPFAPAPVATPTGPTDVALLLPLSGPLAQAGAAVRDAFNSVMPAHVYDTGASADGVVQAYRRAAAEGATLAVGPLVKDGAAALAAGDSLPIPVLTLNYIDSTATHLDGLFQFGLAPEDEAAAAAEDAYAHGLRRAVTMTPTGEWGERVLAAFRNRLTGLGGMVVDSVRYVPGTNDYGTPIRSLLKLGTSEARRKAVSGALGVSLEFTPQPRADTDYVFIAARAAQARLIVPQLRYYRAQELPVYATSAAYDGGNSLDIAGLRICDMPVLMQDGVTGPVDVARLGALGRDAAQLAQAMRSHVLAPGATLGGATGRLSVDATGAVHRQLSCATITDTGLRPLH